MSRKEKIKHLLDQLTQGLVEREEVIKLTLLSSLAGESIFLLGPPGVGKSLIARRIKFAFKQGKSFEYLMTRFSTPDELFGPVSIKKLKDEDKYERKTEEYLPGANIVFLDEIWKAGPAIQNALLTILNEKIFRNGEDEQKVDIKGIITASNELPPTTENYAPLWDRFLIRYLVTEIKDQSNFLKMISGTEELYEDPVANDVKITNEELEQWEKAIDEVSLPEEVLTVIQIIRERINQFNEKLENQEKITAYDRRWKKIVRLLRTSAYMNGRSYVDLMDCFLIGHCLWGRPQHITSLHRIVAESIRKHGYSVSIKLTPLKKEIEEFEEEVRSEVFIKHVTTEEELATFDEEYLQLHNESDQFKGAYIKIQDFNRLSVDEYKILNLYDKDFNLVNRLDAKKSSQQYSVIIRHNSIDYVTALETAPKEKVVTIEKKPHEALLKLWSGRFDHLYKYISEKKDSLEKERPDELDSLANHLFVEDELAELVRKNLDEVTGNLNTLQLSLEKIQHLYQSNA